MKKYTNSCLGLLYIISQEIVDFEDDEVEIDSVKKDHLYMSVRSNFHMPTRSDAMLIGGCADNEDPPYFEVFDEQFQYFEINVVQKTMTGINRRPLAIANVQVIDVSKQRNERVEMIVPLTQAVSGYLKVSYVYRRMLEEGPDQSSTGRESGEFSGANSPNKGAMRRRGSVTRGVFICNDIRVFGVSRLKKKVVAVFTLNDSKPLKTSFPDPPKLSRNDSKGGGGGGGGSASSSSSSSSSSRRSSSSSRSKDEDAYVTNDELSSSKAISGDGESGEGSSKSRWDSIVTTVRSAVSMISSTTTVHEMRKKSAALHINLHYVGHITSTLGLSNMQVLGDVCVPITKDTWERIRTGGTVPIRGSVNYHSKHKNDSPSYVEFNCTFSYFQSYNILELNKEI